MWKGKNYQHSFSTEGFTHFGLPPVWEERIYPGISPYMGEKKAYPPTCGEDITTVPTCGEKLPVQAIFSSAWKEKILNFLLKSRESCVLHVNKTCM